MNDHSGFGEPYFLAAKISDKNCIDDAFRQRQRQCGKRTASGISTTEYEHRLGYRVAISLDQLHFVQLPEGVTPSVHITQNEFVVQKYTVKEVPLDDSGDDEFFPVISGTGGGNENTKISNNSERSNSTCRNTNTGSGSTPKKNSQRVPKRKSQFYSRYEVNDGYFAKTLPSKEAREQVSKFAAWVVKLVMKYSLILWKENLIVFFHNTFANIMPGIKNKATSKLNSVYDEIRPTIVVHGRDNQDRVPTSVSEKWIVANCSKYKADLEFYFSLIKNVMCPLAATDATAAGPSEEGDIPQEATAEVKPSEGGAE